MQPHRTRVFRSGNSQAVRLPKAIGYPDGTELELVRTGDVVILQPVRTSFQAMVERLKALPAPDYVEVRDTEEIPERKGL